MHENKTEKLLRIISELRDPISGCEWTKSQTSKTLLPFITEEAKEVHDAFEKGDIENFKEELGTQFFLEVFDVSFFESIMNFFCFFGYKGEKGFWSLRFSPLASRNRIS